MISFSLVEINEFIQVLSYVGTYSFNLIVVTIFLVPTVILFDAKLKTKLLTFFLTAILIISNLIFGNFILNKHNNVSFLFQVKQKVGASRTAYIQNVFSTR